MERTRTARDGVFPVSRRDSIAPRIPLRRLPAARVGSPLALLVFLALAACSSVRGEVPDMGAFSYPTAVVSDPAGDTVYVVSTNFDSRWQFGWVTPIDVASLTILGSAGVETGSFAGEPVFESQSGKASRMVLPIRDDDTLALIDVARDRDGKALLSCGADLPDGRRRCGTDQSVSLLDVAKDREGNAVPAYDPFAVAIGSPVALPDDSSTFERPLYVGSLVDGTFLVFSLREGEMPVYQGYQTLEEGLHTLVEVPISGNERVVLAGTRARNVMHVVRVRREDGVWTALAEEPVSIPQMSATGDYLRGMALSPRSPVLYVAYRSPSALAVFDIPADGRPVLRNFVALAGLPAGVAVYAPEGGPEIVYVTDFQGDSVYAVDPGIPAVIDRVPVGQGPYGIAIAGDLAFVADFEDQKVSVVALGLADPDRHREIKRLP